MSNEKYTMDQVISAIIQWLEFGENDLRPVPVYDHSGNVTTNMNGHHKLGHKGYFSTGGFAYEALKQHLTDLELLKTIPTPVWDVESDKDYEKRVGRSPDPIANHAVCRKAVLESDEKVEVKDQPEGYW